MSNTLIPNLTRASMVSLDNRCEMRRDEDSMTSMANIYVNTQI